MFLVFLCLASGLEGKVFGASPSPLALPIAFEENRGQWDARARFRAPAGDLTAWFADDAVFLEVSPGRGDRTRVIRMHWDGTGASTRPAGELRQAGVRHFLHGTAPAGWHRNVPAYGQVVYPGIRPGVDIRFRDEGKRLKYDVLVAPGADLGAVVFACEGIDALSIDGEGSLVLGTGAGSLRQPAPVAWSVLPSGAHAPVVCRYEKRGVGRYGFRADARDPALPLVIDPALVYSTLVGGTADDQCRGIVADPDGNAYVTGWTRSADFPAREGAFQRGASGEGDAFVAKLNPAGTELIYATYLGGAGDDSALGIALNGRREASITGWTRSQDFPATPGAFRERPAGGLDAFLATVSADGSRLLYATFLGGADDDLGACVALADGEIVVAGETRSADFPLQDPADTPSGGADAFVARFRADGGGLVFSTCFGGSGTDRARGVAARGNRIYVTGETFSGDLPVSGDAVQGVRRGATDAFLAGFDASGGLLYATYCGGSGNDAAFGVALDEDGGVYIAGETGSADFPVRNPLDATLGGGADAFVVKFTGSLPEYATFLGGAARDGARAIAVDAQGNAFVAGLTESPDFPTAVPLDGTYGGSGDSFLSWIGPTGRMLPFSTYWGGSRSDAGLSVFTDGTYAYLTGFSQSEDFKTTPGAFDRELNGPGDSAFIDGFVIKIDLSRDGGTSGDEDDSPLTLQPGGSTGGGAPSGSAGVAVTSR